MVSRKQIQRFFEEFDRMRSGESGSITPDLPVEDRQALGLAQALGKTDFSSESHQKAALYSRLLARASAPDFKSISKKRSGGFSWADVRRVTAWAALGLFLVVVMVWGINNLIPGFGQDPARLTALPVVLPEVTGTPLLSDTEIQTASPTLTPPVIEDTYCQQLVDSYQPSAGFQLYCDEDYYFAFEYPNEWRIELVSKSMNSKIQRFYNPNQTNFIRVDSWRSLAPLLSVVDQHHFYEVREFPEKVYPPMMIGGETAYGFMNAWEQSISGVLLFFQHGETYSIMELPAYSQESLEINWKIARSIQVPGSTPQDNVIPQEFISDSYTLLERAPNETLEPAVAPVRQYEGWEIIGYLTCAQLKTYDWVWNWASSGEYESTTPIFGVDKPVIYLPEIRQVCPNFSILPAVYAYDEWEVIGFLTCSELEQYYWVWTTREVGWYYSTTPLFGEEKPRINIHYGWSCPGFRPLPPVRDPDSHEIIGFLTCSQLEENEWVEMPDGSGYYSSTTPIFGVESPLIWLHEVRLLCSDFPPPEVPRPGAFNPGANAYVSALVIQPDGKILVGGDFSVLGGVPRNLIGRLNSAGQIDVDFNPGMAEGAIYAMALQADGKIVVGGFFTTMGGQPRQNLARLNPDGSLDITFNPGADFWVDELVVQSDGKILVGGSFNTLGGQPRNYLGRLNPDGSLDTTFNPGADLPIDVLAVQADGKILVGGYFSELAGQPREHIGRLNPDGSLDLTFDPGANHRVYALAIQPDGKIVVGGEFSTLGGQTRNYIGRLNLDGSLDPDFTPRADAAVQALTLQADGKLVLGGWFTTLGGQTRHHIGRLNSDGTLDQLFDPRANGEVGVLAMQTDGKILVGGWFNMLAAQARQNIGRLKPNGSLD
jgi:uncharacterized delta-60 repeat protein